MLAGHIGLAFDSGLGVSASARARRPCQLRGAWLQTRSGRRVQELLATPPIESGVSRDESGARDEGGARDTPISGKRRAASLALALAISGGKRRVPGGPNQVASRARLLGTKRDRGLLPVCCTANWSVAWPSDGDSTDAGLWVWPPSWQESGRSLPRDLLWLRFRYSAPPPPPPPQQQQPHQQPQQQQQQQQQPQLLATVLAPADATCGECTPRPAARAIFFNRVPKCGSTTLESIITLQADRRKFRFERSADYVNNSIDATEQRRVVNLVVQLAREERLLCLAITLTPTLTLTLALTLRLFLTLILTLILILILTLTLTLTPNPRIPNPNPAPNQERVLYDRHVLLVDFTLFGQVRSKCTR